MALIHLEGAGSAGVVASVSGAHLFTQVLGNLHASTVATYCGPAACMRSGSAIYQDWRLLMTVHRKISMDISVSKDPSFASISPVSCIA